MNQTRNHRPVIAAGTVLGIGLGGFVDGILFHQILQWHNMLTGKYPKEGVELATQVVHMEVNMFWDGLFHVFTWLITVFGIFLLWRAGQQRDLAWSTRVFAGSLPLGWGLFNLVEGTINHHLLHLHHVVEGPNHLPWDLGFLVSGVVLSALGLTLIATGRRSAADPSIIPTGQQIGHYGRA